MNIYRLCYKVRPSPKHPRYYEIQFGFLSLFLLDETSANAQKRASAILDQLPYECASDMVAVYSEQGDYELPPAWLVDCRVMAYRYSFSFYFEAWEVGTEEGEFVTAPFPGEKNNPKA